MEKMSFSSRINLSEEEKWFLGVTSSEATIFYLDLTDENNSFSITTAGDSKRNKYLIEDKDRVKQSYRINPWNNYYAKDKYKFRDEIIKQCDSLKPITFQEASEKAKNTIDLLSFFLRQGGSIFLNEPICNGKRNGISAVAVNSKRFLNLSKELRDDDAFFELVVRILNGYESVQMKDLETHRCDCFSVMYVLFS